MTPLGMLYLFAMALVYGGQRLLAGEGATAIALTALGVVGALVAVLGRLRAAAGADASVAAAHRAAFRAGLAGLGSLVLYALSTDAAVEAMSLGEEAATRWQVALQALWPIAWLAGTLPLLAVDRAIAASPVVTPALRVRQAMQNGLAAALALSLVFPVNYVASAHNHRWDLAYFKTTEAGTATRNLVANLQQPVDVRIFLPTSSDVAHELEAYFSALEGPNLRVRFLDHAAEPRLARLLRVRDNGYIAFSVGEVDLDDPDADRPTTKTLKVGTDLKSARRTLRKLDQEVQKILIDLAKGKRRAYFVMGHGEFSWRGSSPVDRRVSALKKLLEAMNFRVKELGMAQGLSEDVPDDADVVFLLGPEQPLLPEEVASLERYLDRGGSLLVALEPRELHEGGELAPEEDPLDELLRRMGLQLGRGVLASETNFLRATYEKSDRMNVATNRFSSHPSTRILARNSQALALVTPGAGWLDELKSKPEGVKVTVTVRSMPDNFADLDGDLELDRGAESKRIRPLAAAVTGPAPEAAAGEEPGEGDGDEAGGDDAPTWRAVVLADATALSDLVLIQVRGNQQFVWDAANWLLGEEEVAGTVESEEDVKIQHTRDDQVAWFYGTIVGIPMLVFLLGLLRVRQRRGGDS